MKKVLLGLGMAALVVGAFGCSNSSNTETKTAAQAAPAAESLRTVEAMYQRNDPAPQDAKTALHCVYVYGQNTGGTIALSKADVKTSGSCNWQEMKSKAAPAGTLGVDAAARIVSAATSVKGLPGTAKAKWDCTAINIETNVHRMGVQDCKNGSGVGNDIARSIAGILGL